MPRLQFPLGKCLKLLRAKRPIAAVVRHRRRLRPLPKVIALSRLWRVFIILYECFAQSVRWSCMVVRLWWRGGGGHEGFIHEFTVITNVILFCSL